MLSPAWTYALAIPVPSGTAPSSDLIVSFDYGAAGEHAGPYVSSAVFIGFNPPFAGTTVAIDLFGGPNGVDLLESSVTAPFYSIENTYQEPGLYDGVFSVGVRSIVGTAVLDFANSIGTWIFVDTSTMPPTTTFGTTGEVMGQIVTSPSGVPEPGTLALITIAVAALVGGRRPSVPQRERRRLSWSIARKLLLALGP
jgi:hypothetical protein